MSFTSGYRVTTQKPCKAIADINLLSANADDLASRIGYLDGHFFGSLSVTNTTNTDAGFSTGSAAFWTIANPTQIIIPTGYNRVQFDVNVKWSSASSVVYSYKLTQNAADFAGQMYYNVNEFAEFGQTSPIYQTSAGTIYRVTLLQGTGGTISADVSVSVRAWK